MNTQVISFTFVITKFVALGQNICYIINVMESAGQTKTDFYNLVNNVISLDYVQSLKFLVA